MATFASEGAADTTPTNQELVEAIHATDVKLVIYVTGGGSQAISELLVVPGASNTVLEAAVPYAQPALAELLGAPPQQYCSADTAAELARAAYRRAAQLTPIGSPIIGISCTAALRTDRPKSGPHRMHMACHTGAATEVYSVTLEKGTRSRAEEEALCARGLLSLAVRHAARSAADALLPAWPQFPGLSGGEEMVKIERALGADAVDALLAGEVDCVEIAGGQTVVDGPRVGVLLLSGSFNPLHEGHIQLLAAAARATGRTDAGVFELCVDNADKGTLERDEVNRRLAQFAERGLPVVLTRAPLFTQKARLFRGAAFVLGYDTAKRIVMRKYYNDSDVEMALQFAALRDAGCSVVVGGRIDGDSGEFLGLKDVAVPAEIDKMGLFVGVAEEEFRVDVSSTELRRRATQQ